MKKICALLVCLTLPVFAQQAPWQHPLYLDNGGYWPNRVKITASSPTPLDGAPQTLIVGQNSLALAGSEARSVRVLDDAKQELLFNLTSADGTPRHEGKIANGDKLTLPLELAAGQTRAFWIYWGNEKAGLVPDFLPGGFANGTIESGEGAPLAWKPEGNDDAHLLRWESDARSGKKALYAEAKPGASSEWFKWAQTGLPVAPGQQIELRAWVKGENVVGSAGFYVHVNGAKPQIVNQVIKAGDGTFDWKEAIATFIVPETGATMDIGTVLYGTGKAWFDDVSLKISGGENGAAKLDVGAVETVKLKPRPVAHQRAFLPRVNPLLVVPITVYHIQAKAIPTLVTANLQRALFISRLRQPVYWQLVSEGNWIHPARLDKGILTFQTSFFPLNGVETFKLLLSSDKNLRPSPTLAEAALAEGPVNRLQNASFESGGDLPNSWPLSAQKTDGKPVGSAKRVRGGKDGNWAVELTIPPDAKANWSGWHQFAPVQAGAKYLIGAWLRTKDSGGAELNAHWRGAGKKLVKENAFTGAGLALSGTNDWTWRQNIVTAPPDAKFIEIHLTTNTTGTLWHDGVVVRQLKETLTASVGPLRASSAPAPHPAPELRVWQASTALKIFKDDAVHPDVKACEISLARNERESLQLVLRSAKPSSVKIAVSPLKNAAGETLPVEIARVGYVPVDYPTNYYRLDKAKAWERKIPTGTPGSDGWAGDWPDPLYPLKNGDSVQLNAGEAQPLYFIVHAPESAVPRLYNGEYTSDYKGEISIGSRKIPLRVHLRSFMLPKTPSLQITFDLRGPKAPSEASWYRFLAEHHVSPGYLPEPKFTLENGEVKADFADYDKAAALCFDELGMSTMYTPDQFYALGWAYAPRKFLGTTAFTPEWEKTFGGALKLWADHVRAKGWLSKFTFYLSDEPFDTPEVAENLQKFSRFVQKTVPGLPIYSSTWTHMKALDGAVTRWGAGHVGMFPVADIKERKKAGDSFWFTTDGQQCLDTPYLGTERLLSWACFKYGVKGFEFWGVNWWTLDPHRFGWHRYISQSDSEKSAGYYIRYPNGDGYLAYPSKDGPISSIRLEAVRDGAEDYEYLRLLHKKLWNENGITVVLAREIFLMALLRETENQVSIPNAGGRYSSKNQSDPTALLKLRDKIGDAIEGPRR